MFKAVAILALAAVCVADDAYRPAPYAPAPYKQQGDYYAEPKYAFDWAVKDDYSYNNYGQYEKRDGANTDGSYRVLLPDGRVQNVNYYVNGDSGYVADVTYSGEAKYDNAYNKPAPSYKVDTYAPAPAYKADPYRPAPSYKVDTYAPAPAYNKPAYKPAYAPAPYKAAPAYAPVAYKAAPAYPTPSYAPAPYKARY